MFVLRQKLGLQQVTREVACFVLALASAVAVAQEEPNLPAEDQDLPVEAPPETEGTMKTPGTPPAPPTPPANGNNAPAAPATPAAGAAPATSNPNANAPAKPAAVVKVPAKGAAAVPAGQELVNIDFPEPTEIKDIIKAVALWTGKNVILDRNVNGKVQIISPRKVTKEEAYQAFLSALNLLQLTTVETGKVIKIMPVRTAIKGNLKTYLGSSWTPMTDEIITQILPLKYIDAKEIQATLSRIVASNSMIAYPPTNTLIISDSGYKVRRVIDILELLDVQGQQSQVAIVPIRFAEAKSIADKVSEIFKNSAAAKKGSGSSGYRSYKIMTDERTNSVIIFGPPRTIADVKALVRKFDIQLDDPSRQSTVHVRPLDYADAKKLATTLSALATGNKNKGSGQIRRPPINQVPGMPGMPEPLSVAELSDDVKIAPDESSNALLITGSHAAYQTINTLIRKLDIRRSQVFVETDILDINFDSGFEFGTSIFAGRGGPGSSAIATAWQAKQVGPLVVAQATQGANGTQSQTNVEKAAGVFATEDMTVGILSGKEIEVAGLGKFRPGALIRMIKTDANTRVLSSPNILTANNEEAQIVVGETLFFTSKETSAQTGVVANKVEREKVDLTLTVKPSISHSNYVTLQVNLEANDLAGIVDGLPRVNRRTTKQNLTVKNAQTVVISGLVKNAEYQTFKKIPLLGDIPILGWLFRNSQTSTKRNSLMIFLTPHVIHGADDLASVYKQKIDERDQFLASIFGSRHVQDDFYALLPTKEDGEYRADDSDKAEKARREEMLKEMYQSSGMTPMDPAKPADAAEESAADGEDGKKKKGGKLDESPTYVPLSPDEGGGFEGGGGGGGDAPAPPEPPEPPPPPPEPESPPE